jgi:AraC-like DNA-binding protein
VAFSPTFKTSYLTAQADRSNYTIGEIAAMCGFGNPFHFSRRFKEAFDLSPRTMRQRLAAGMTPPVPLLTRSSMDRS